MKVQAVSPLPASLTIDVQAEADRIAHWMRDALSRTLRRRGLVVAVSGGIDSSVCAALAVRAVKLLQTPANVAKGADIHVEKRIPTGGGLGGGSSDAATVLRVLDRLWGCDLGEDTLAGLGLQLGADVPVFVRGQNAWAEGLGERLTPIALPPAWYLLVAPDIHAATAELFQAAELTRNAAAATMSDFVSDPFLQGQALGNAFEPVLRRREPAVEAVLAALRSAGAARLTGSGSVCFVEFADRESAERALARLPSGLAAWIAAGVPRSPLLDALETKGRDW